MYLRKLNEYFFWSLEFHVCQKNFSLQKDHCKKDQRTLWNFRSTEFSFRNMNARMCHRNLCMFFAQVSISQREKDRSQWRHSFAKKDSTSCFLVLRLHEQCQKNAWVKVSHKECWEILVEIVRILPLQRQRSSETLTNQIQTNHSIENPHRMQRKALSCKLLLLHFEWFWYFLLKCYFQHWDSSWCFLLRHFLHRDLSNEHFRKNLFRIPRFFLWRQIIRADGANSHKKRNAKKKRNMWPLKNTLIRILLLY